MALWSSGLGLLRLWLELALAIGALDVFGDIDICVTIVVAIIAVAVSVNEVNRVVLIDLFFIFVVTDEVDRFSSCMYKLDTQKI